MNLNFNNYRRFLIIIPALAAFIITSILTLKYQWPLSWDIIFHVEYAKIYSQQGFAFQENYPPLFHFLIALLSDLFNIDYFQIARFLQPVLAMSIVLSVSYMANKLYGNLAGISAGFLMVSSYMAFRIMMPLPENLALIFLIFSVYFYYVSISEIKLKYAWISGVLLLLAVATHRNVPLFLILILSLFTLLELLIYRNKSVLKNYATFLLPLIVLFGGGVFILLLWKSDFLTEMVRQGISTYMIYFISSSEVKPISIFKYIAFLGVLVSVFSFIGGIAAIKKREKPGIFMIAWVIAVFLLSNSYLFGFNVESVRFLIYMLVPLSILGGFGLSQVYHKLKESGRFSSPRFRSAFLISMFALALFFGLLLTEKSFAFYSESSLGNIQIAPPSSSEVDLANWFEVNANKEKKVIVSNRYSGIFLSSMASMVIDPDFGSFDKNTRKSVFDRKDIGYIVYDKRLTFPSKTFYRVEALNKLNQSSKLFYYGGDVHRNIHKIMPGCAKVVYENEDFIVCAV